MGDGGVDGVIREDQLGLDRVYLQAKRYQLGNTIGSETVQAFIGALRLVLIDGAELTRLMVRFNVGVRVARTVEIKRIDLGYFDETE